MNDRERIAELLKQPSLSSDEVKRLRELIERNLSEGIFSTEEWKALKEWLISESERLSKSADELLRTLDFTKPENRRLIALAYLEEDGDVPLWLEHTFRMTSANAADMDAMHAMIDEVRAEHFAKLGQPVPERTGPRLR